MLLSLWRRPAAAVPSLGTSICCRCGRRKKKKMDLFTTPKVVYYNSKFIPRNTFPKATEIWVGCIYGVTTARHLLNYFKGHKCKTSSLKFGESLLSAIWLSHHKCSLPTFTYKWPFIFGQSHINLKRLFNIKINIPPCDSICLPWRLRPVY